MKAAIFVLTEINGGALMWQGMIHQHPPSSSLSAGMTALVA
jgi:hypothetical protein